MSTTYDLIVVGEGFAGLACAAEASRLGLKVGSFEAGFFGGLVVNVNELEAFDEAEGLSGMDYAGTLANANRKAGVKSNNAEVSAIRAQAHGFDVVTDSGTHSARCVVIASGARLKKLGVAGEAEFEGRGVSHCADCDAPMFTDQAVVVAGAGDWALQDALLLARDCSAVHLVFEEPEPTACALYLQRAQAQPRIHFHPRQRIEAVLGTDSGMTGVRLRDAQGADSELAAMGLFALVGLVPNSGIAPEPVQRNGSGHLLVNDALETGVPGLWAIGQVRAGFGGWLKDAVADARLAAAQVQARLA